MSIDTSALRAAAEGATPGDWIYPNSLSGHAGLTTGADVLVGRPCDAAYAAAANPVVVLELLDELDWMRTQFGIELRRSAAYAAELDRWIREGSPSAHNRPLSDARVEVAPESVSTGERVVEEVPGEWDGRGCDE